MKKALLKAAVYKNGLIFGNISELIGITRAALSLKVNGKNQFTQSEISKIKTRLSLSAEETCNIFLDK